MTILCDERDDTTLHEGLSIDAYFLEDDDASAEDDDLFEFEDTLIGVNTKETSEITWDVVDAVESDSKSEKCLTGTEHVSVDENAWKEIEAAVNKRLIQQSLSEEELGEKVGLKRTNKKPMGRKRKRVKTVLTQAEKMHLVTLHQVHLLCLLAYEKRQHDVLRDHGEVLQAVALSTMNMKEVERMESLENRRNRRDIVALLIQRMHEEYDVLPYGQLKTFDNNSKHDLLRVMQQRRGFPHQINMIFILLCRAISIPTRYTCCLDPRKLTRSRKVEQHFGLDLEACAERFFEHKTKSSVFDRSSSRLPLRFWVEVLLPEHAKSDSYRWISIDPLRRLVDEPLEMERVRGNGKILPYVVSFEESGRLVDVTIRYATRWSKTILQRLPPPAIKWWQNLLHSLSETLEEKHNHFVVNEAKEWEEKLSQEPLPTSLNAFKTNYKYCLERHIGTKSASFEPNYPSCPQPAAWIGRQMGLYPRKVVGMFKGEPVFHRMNVHRLYTKYQWSRRGRTVALHELQMPCKILQESSSRRGDKSDASNESIQLYGEWQTKPLDPPVIGEDGKIPKNIHGNIEMFTKHHLPVGARHLTLPRIATLAKSLNVDYARALIGFEVKNGLNCPVFDGIVVKEDLVDVLVSAHATMQQQTLERAIAKNQALACNRWKRLVRKLLLRRRLENDYGKYNKQLEL